MKKLYKVLGGELCKIEAAALEGELSQKDALSLVHVTRVLYNELVAKEEPKAEVSEAAPKKKRGRKPKAKQAEAGAAAPEEAAVKTTKHYKKKADGTGFEPVETSTN